MALKVQYTNSLASAWVAGGGSGTNIINPTGRVVNAATPLSQANIQAALNSANPGDLVQLPAGTCTITSTGANNFGLTCYKGGVSINGAGATTKAGGQPASFTRLVYSSTGADATPMVVLDGSASTGQAFSISNIECQGQLSNSGWQGTNRTSQVNSNLDMGVAILGACGKPSPVLVFNCYFTNFTHSALSFWGMLAHGLPGKAPAAGGHPNAVVFNNYFFDNWNLNEGYGVEIYSNCTSPTDDTWAISSTTFAGNAGGGKYVYVEDNYFEQFRHSVATSNGAIYVERYNTLDNGYHNAAYSDMHGLNPNHPAGGRWREFYNNACGNDATFDSGKAGGSTPYTVCDARGGGGVGYNNTILSGKYWPSWFIVLSTESNNPTQNQVGNPDPQYFWAGTGTVTAKSGIYTVSSGGYTVNKDFFNAPPASGQGHPLTSYTAYPYPHAARATSPGSGDTTCPTQAFANPVTSGNFVAGHVSWDNKSGQTLSSVKDDKNNTYTLGAVANITANNQAHQTFFLGNITNGPTIITATFSAATDFQGIEATEYTFSGAAALDTRISQVQAPGPGAGTDLISSGSASGATTGTTDLQVGYFLSGTTADATINPGTGFFGDGQLAVSAKIVMAMEESQVASGAIAKATWTAPGGGAANYSTIAETYFPAPTPPPPTTPTYRQYTNSGPGQWTATAAPNVSATFAQPVAQGSFVVGHVSWDTANAGSFTISDGLAAGTNNWIQDVANPVTADSQGNTTFYAYNVQGGPTKITITFNNSANFTAMEMVEYTGVRQPSDPADGIGEKQVMNPGPGTGAGAIKSGPGFSTTAPNDLAVGFIVATTAVDTSITVPSPWTGRSFGLSGGGPGAATMKDASNHIFMTMEDQVVANQNTSVSAQFTGSTGTGKYSVIMTPFFAAQTSPPPSGITFRQYDNSGNSQWNATLVNSIKLSLNGTGFGQAVALGSLLVGHVSWGSGTVAISSITDNASGATNTWNHVLQGANTGDAQSHAIIYALNVQGSPTDVTVTFGATVQFTLLEIAEYTGAASTDGAGAASMLTSGTAINSPSITTTQPNDLVVGFFATSSAPDTTLTAVSPYTLRGTISDSTSHFLFGLEDQIQPSAGAITSRFTASPGGGHYFAAVIAFSPGTTTGSGNIWQGSASLAGLASGVIGGIHAEAIFTGGATLVATPTVPNLIQDNGPDLLPASGNLTATTILKVAASMAPAGTGNLIATATIQHTFVDTGEVYSGAGTLTADSVLRRIASSPFLGAGTAVANAVVARLQIDNGPDPLPAAGSLSATALRLTSGATSLVGAGGMPSSGSVLIRLGSLNLAGAGLLSAIAAVKESASISLPGQGSLVATATSVRIQIDAGPENLIGSGAINALITEVAHTSAALLGGSTLFAIAGPYYLASTSLAGAGTLAASIGAIRMAAASGLAGAGSVTAIASGLSTGASANLAGAGATFAAANVISAASSLISSVNNLPLNANEIFTGNTQVLGASNMAAPAVLLLPSQGQLAGSSSLFATVASSPTANATLAGGGILAAAAGQRWLDTAALAGLGAASAQGFVAKFANALLAGQGTGTITATTELHFATAVLGGTGFTTGSLPTPQMAATGQTSVVTNSLSVLTTVDIPAGSSIIVLADNAQPGNQMVSVTDGSGNAYVVEAADTQAPAANWALCQSSGLDLPLGSTITITFNGIDQHGVAAFFSDTSGFDINQVVAGTGTQATAIVSTPGQVFELLTGIVTNNAAPGTLQGTDASWQLLGGNGGAQTINIFTKYVFSPGTPTWQPSWTNNVAYCSRLISFLPNPIADVVSPASIALAGAGTLAANAGIGNRASLFGLGVLAAAAIQIMVDSGELLAGHGGTIDTEVPQRPASAEADGAGVLNALAGQRYIASTSLAGSSTLFALANAQLASAALNGTSTMLAPAALQLPSAASLGGAGQLQFSVIETIHVQAILAGGGTISATSFGLTTNANLAGSSALAETSDKVLRASNALLGGQAALTVSTRLIERASAVLPASGILAEADRVIRRTSAFLAGFGIMQARAGGFISQGNAILFGETFMRADSVEILPAAAFLAGGGFMPPVVATPTRAIGTNAALAGAGSLNATRPAAIQAASAALVAQSTLDAPGSLRLPTAAALAGTGNSAAQAQHLPQGAMSLGGSGQVVCAAREIEGAVSAVVAGSSGMVCSASILTASVNATLPGAGIVQANSTQVVLASVVLAGQGNSATNSGGIKPVAVGLLGGDSSIFLYVDPPHHITNAVLEGVGDVDPPSEVFPAKINYRSRLDIDDCANNTDLDIADEAAVEIEVCDSLKRAA